VYCVGGFESKSVYYAPITPSGLGTWTQQTATYPLPTAANLISCASTETAIYCIGGQSGSLISSSVYDGTLSVSGVGQWTAAPDYPLALLGESCVSSPGAIYCVGGEDASLSLTGTVAFIGAS
jgi:hypothetical protein